MLAELTKRSLTEDISSEPLLSLCVLESLAPVSWSELENTLTGPPGQEAEEIPQVRDFKKTSYTGV
jgi:hypothetical protein